MEWQHPAQAKPERRGIHGGVGPAKGESRGVGMLPMSSCAQGREKTLCYRTPCRRGRWAEEGAGPGRFLAAGREEQGAPWPWRKWSSARGDGELTARARAGPAMAGLLQATPRTSRESRGQGEQRARREGKSACWLEEDEGKEWCAPMEDRRSCYSPTPLKPRRGRAPWGLCASCCISTEQLARRS
jgi:hypothetical protein